MLSSPADTITADTITENEVSNEVSADQYDASADLGSEEQLSYDDVPAADEAARTLPKDSKDIGFSLEEFASLLSKYDYHFNPGDVVAGTVFNLEPKGALIDIGAKTAAFMPLPEISINRVDNLEDVLQPGDTREFFIVSEENEDGQLTLSIRRIEYMKAWERVRQLEKEDATIYSEVFATNRGGALVRVEGLRGFIPGSHISTRKPKEELVMEALPLKFLEVDEERNRLVLSHRRALVERKMNRLEVGEVVIGNVRGIKPYGAFIDIGGVSGLLHISEISHEHIETPHTVLNVGDQMKVMIIDLDAERGRISLSTKALEPEPGDMLSDPQKVFDRAEEMAARYKQMLEEQAEGESLEMSYQV
ncbi:MAG: S1 RNA-binding domain-containing protein [Aphanocapsa feldmannii 277cV]|uniref:S1 RNA-binding domain-containing protein n=2 Tax=Aphanocapsa feldmannii TaxID=192050 RepID=A0A524RMR4_9CHRO|nr:MAG: S1 RNA-binding domain-containing protein [Aphanocapsa feldmannii 277cV]TGH20341.1 MAG: S1 RNA-binding domain-containing protein [Aphanocapsa feldmannii 277cI]